MKRKFISAVLLAALMARTIAAAAFAVRENMVTFRFANRSNTTVSRIYIHDWRVGSDNWDSTDIVWEDPVDPGETVTVSFIYDGGRLPKFDIMLRLSNGARDVYEDFDLANIERLILRKGKVLEVE